MIPLAWALISTEALKTRNTAPVWLALVTPLLATFLHLVGLFDRSSFPGGNPGDIWANLLRNAWSFWALFVPILISFEAATLADLEHRGRNWKHLFTMPIPRWSVYATKILFCGLLLAASFCIATLGFVGNVLVYSGVNGYPLVFDIPWLDILNTAGKAYLASWPVVVIQSWLSARFAGVASTVAMGFAALVVGMILMAPFKGVSGSWYPWILTLRTLSIGGAHDTTSPVVFGCVGGLVLGFWVCWDLSRRCQPD